MSECPGCNITKPLSEFHKHRKRSSGVQRSCKSCVSEYQLMLHFNITRAERDQMLEDQGGGCAICGTTDPGNGKSSWSIDHDHECCPGRKSCGECIRGLLCDGCNRGIGQFRDDPNRLMAAVSYLLSRSNTGGEIEHESYPM